MGIERSHQHRDVDDVFQPRRLRGVRSVADLSDVQMFYAYMLTDGHFDRFNPVCVHEDMIDDRYLQSFAQADVPSPEWIVTDKGRHTMPKMIGWTRALLDETMHELVVPHATIENVYIDRNAPREMVEEFLLKRLQGAVRRKRKEIAGLKISIPGSDRERAKLYMRHGFAEPGNDDLFVWEPS